MPVVIMTVAKAIACSAGTPSCRTPSSLAKRHLQDISSKLHNETTDLPKTLPGKSVRISHRYNRYFVLLQIAAIFAKYNFADAKLPWNWYNKRVKFSINNCSLLVTELINIGH